jgi:hypothetical protein
MRGSLSKASTPSQQPFQLSMRLQRSALPQHPLQPPEQPQHSRFTVSLIRWLRFNLFCSSDISFDRCSPVNCRTQRSTMTTIGIVSKREGGDATYASAASAAADDAEPITSLRSQMDALSPRNYIQAEQQQLAGQLL